jgi:hypothetical protein
VKIGAQACKKTAWRCRNNGSVKPFNICRGDSFSFGIYADPEEEFGGGFGRSFSGSRDSLSHRRGVFSAIESYLDKYGGKQKYLRLKVLSSEIDPRPKLGSFYTVGRH